MKPKRSTVIIPVVLIIAAGFAAYINSLNCEFIWDDKSLVTANAYIKSWSNLTGLFTQNLGAIDGRRNVFYRPMQILTYMIDYSLWKLNVKGFHFTSILLHILVALTIYKLINILYHDRFLAFLTGIFFVVHPVHTEAVTYISGRADSLAVLFMLICFILYTGQVSAYSISGFIFMSVSCSLALLSKESSLILPVILLLYHYAFRKKFRIKVYLPLLIIIFVYALLRATVFRPVHALPIPYSTTLFRRIPGFLVAIFNYLKLMLLPFNLHMEYGYRLFKFTHPRAIAGLIIVCSSLFYAFRRRNAGNLIFFSLTWFFAALLPVSNLYPLNAYMAEHWLYLPSIGFFLLLGKGLSYLYKVKNLRALTAVLTVGLLTLYFSLTIRQNGYWKEPIAFYQRTLKYAPDSPRIHTNLGIAYKDAGRIEEAIALHLKAIEINPHHPKTYYNLGNLYKELDEKEKAVTLYRKAIEINPLYTDAYNNLGLVYDELGRTEEAMALYRKVLEIDPHFTDAYYNLGVSCQNTGKSDEAIALYQKALKINPHFATAYNNLGNIYYTLGRNGEAITSFKKAIEIDPDYTSAYNNLGNIYYTVGRYEEAMTLFKKVIGIDPNYVGAYNNLGIICSATGREKKAIAFFRKAVEIDPDYADAYYNLGFAYSLADMREEAISAFKRTIELEAANARAHNDLAVAYYYANQYDLAVKHCDRAIELGHKAHPEFLKLLEPYRK